MLEMERVRELWLQRKGAPPTDGDINRMYAKFVPKNIAALKTHSKLIDGEERMSTLHSLLLPFSRFRRKY